MIITLKFFLVNHKKSEKIARCGLTLLFTRSLCCGVFVHKMYGNPDHTTRECMQYASVPGIAKCVTGRGVNSMIWLVTYLSIWYCYLIILSRQSGDENFHFAIEKE